MARVGANLSSHAKQIRAIRVQIKNTGDNVVKRWLGLQGGKYVSLPLVWVHQNFSLELRKEAVRRAKMPEEGEDQPKRPFIKIPPGDSRSDDPPAELRHEKGMNYYYQGVVDNCLMGGVANAVFYLCGKERSDELLQAEITLSVGCWQKFANHVTRVMKGYSLRRIKCQNILSWDVSLPMVVQLRSRDMSESHAICIFQDCIFDSASRFVLSKTQESLDWCCGMAGFDHHLRLYHAAVTNNYIFNTCFIEWTATYGCCQWSRHHLT